VVHKEAAAQAYLSKRLAVPAARRVVVDTGKRASKATHEARSGQEKKEDAKKVDRSTSAGDLQSSTTSSEIPPTPMTPRGPPPEVIFDTGKTGKSISKTTTQQTRVGEERPAVPRIIDKELTVTRQVDQELAATEFKRELRRPERVERRKEDEAEVKHRKRLLEKELVKQRPADTNNINNSASQVNENKNTATEKRGEEQRVKTNNLVEKQVQANVEQDKV